MDLQLQGKRALVTGSSGGIGEGIVKTLAKEGVAVVVHGRKEQQASRVAQEIAATGGKALVASPLGSYINGANLRVDGGYVVSVN
jgi:NAD(P)-dependent dehydrogenase (short-subunit alcohol dehydrogenase family)